MRKLLIGLFIFLPLAAWAAGPVHVKGYTKRDGTYVAPHYRSAPNSSTFDNYSTRGNYNPYTGARGTVDPYRAQQRSSSYAPFNYQPAPQVQYQAPAPVRHGVIYRCTSMDGQLFYSGTPYQGCVVVGAY